MTRLSRIIAARKATANVSEIDAGRDGSRNAQRDVQSGVFDPAGEAGASNLPNLCAIPADKLTIHDIIAPALEISGPFNRLVECIESGQLTGCDPQLALERLRNSWTVTVKDNGDGSYQVRV